MILGWLDSIIIGIVQGLTEFLPVSSSGHLVIFQKLLNFKEHSITLDLAVHLGTLLSVLTIYYSTIKKTLTDSLISLKTKKNTPGLQLMAVVIAASVPTAIIGLGFKSDFESLFSNILAVATCFFITGGLLFLTKRKSKESSMAIKSDMLGEKVKELTFVKAIIIGIVQGFAIAPGISRSGSTIAVGILLGVDRSVAAMFSFMLSMPAILGASLLQFKDVGEWSSDLIATLLVGGATAYIAGIIGLKLVLRFVGKGRLEVFSYYLWALSIYLFASNLL